MFKALFLQIYLKIMLKNLSFNRCIDVAEEKSCVHYPICYLLIKKYIYANLICASDLIFYLILLHVRAVYIQNLKKTCEKWTFWYNFLMTKSKSSFVHTRRYVIFSAWVIFVNK